MQLNDIENISTRVVRDYVDVTRKTLLHDIRALQTMELIEVDKGLVRPKRETVLAFLPHRRTQ